jgi:hypothetical protein
LICKRLCAHPHGIMKRATMVDFLVLIGVLVFVVVIVDSPSHVDGPEGLCCLWRSGNQRTRLKQGFLTHAEP